jgi:hypothetical protein
MGGVVHTETPLTGKPGLRFGLLVGAVVVDDQIHIETSRDVALDMAQEALVLQAQFRTLRDITE